MPLWTTENRLQRAAEEQLAQAQSEAPVPVRLPLRLRLWLPSQDEATRRELKERAIRASEEAFAGYSICEWVSAPLREENPELAAEVSGEVNTFMAKFCVGMAIEYGALVVAEDAETGALRGAMTLVLYNKLPQSGLWRTLTLFGRAVVDMGIVFRHSGLPAALRGARGKPVQERMNGFNAVGKEHMAAVGHRPHIYLMQLSVCPASQRSGVGTALLQFLAKLADSLELPVYLETQSEGHVEYYGRMGFAEARRFAVLDFEPNIGMLREHGSAS